MPEEQETNNNNLDHESGEDNNNLDVLENHESGEPAAGELSKSGGGTGE